MQGRWTQVWYRTVLARAACVLAAVWVVALFVSVDCAWLPRGSVRVLGIANGAVTYIEGDRRHITLDRFVQAERHGVAWTARAGLPAWKFIAWLPYLRTANPTLYYFLRPPAFDMAFPLWIPALAAALPAAVLWIPLTRRRGLCRSCRYDLRGLPVGNPCPECGRKRT